MPAKKDLRGPISNNSFLRILFLSLEKRVEIFLAGKDSTREIWICRIHGIIW